MSAETDLYAALTARSLLVALVGTRIYPDAAPEGKAVPLVVYQRASTTPITTVHGETVAEEIRFAVTAWAKSRTEADAVGDEIVAALFEAGNPYTDRAASIDPETGLFACAIETDWFDAF